MRSQSNSFSPLQSAKFHGEPACAPQPHYWITSAQAAELLKIKTHTILFWARQGKIKACPFTGVERRVWRFLQSDLDAILINSRLVISSAQPPVPCSKGAQ